MKYTWSEHHLETVFFFNFVILTSHSMILTSHSMINTNIISIYINLISERLQNNKNNECE